MRAYGMSESQERQEKVASAYLSEYGQKPQYWFSSPARVELMGGHTEHNFGRGIFATISCDILCAAGRRQDDKVEIRSEEFDPVSFSVYDLENREREKGKAVSLARGVLRYLKGRGYSFRGFSVYLHNKITGGAGAYSAALAVLFAKIINTLYYDNKISPMECAMAGNYAESFCFGKASALSDHAAIIFGGMNYFDYAANNPVNRLNLFEGYKVVLVKVSDSLDWAQHEIQREMSAVASYFGEKALYGVRFSALFRELAGLKKRVGAKAVLSAMYYYEECDRTEYAAQAIQKNDVDLFLRLMQRSGEGGLRLLEGCSGSGCAPMALTLKAGYHLIKNGACRMMSGTAVAIIKEGEEQPFVKAMIHLFGRENVLTTSFRRTGCTQIEI